jgi:ABC-type sugar transport system ATPase subunit
MIEEKQIEFNNVTFGYNKKKPVFENLSFKIVKPKDEGFVVGLMGSSGSGKSTILKLILGIEKISDGTISILPQQPVISYVPQDPVLFEHLSPKENARYFERISNYKSLFKEKLFDEITNILQIDDILKTTKSVNEISGGQKQRISLLRALSIAPDILLLDEPLTGLDEEVKDMFLQTIAMLVKRYNLLVVYVTHHRKEVEFIADKILYLLKDNNSDLVNATCYEDTDIFFKFPPTISVLKVAREISTNILFFEFTANKAIKILKDKSDNTMLMSFEENIITFNDSYGIEYERIASTGKYILLKLKDSGIILTVSKEYEQNSNKKLISFNGEIKLYDNKENFIKITKIENNIIFI